VKTIPEFLHDNATNQTHDLSITSATP